MNGHANLIACLTPPGKGAIATLALRGPMAWPVVRDLFQPRAGKGLPEVPEPGRFWLGRLGDGATADDVVLAVRKIAPTCSLEIHCHGGPEVVSWLLEIFLARGFQSRAWQEFEIQTGSDPLQVAAAAALAEAPTLRTANILHNQYHGAFSGAVTACVAGAESSKPRTIEADRGFEDSAPATLEQLAKHAGLGRHLIAPWRVAVLGPPNVGKSSLVNALTGYQRSVVSPIPGTTRDVVTTVIAVDGWPVELADTAGLRESAGNLEEQGIDLARAAAADADLRLWILDASAPPVWPDPSLTSVQLVVNKVDMPPTWDLDQRSDAVRVSALVGTGIAELCRLLSHWLVPDPPPAGAGVPFTPMLCDQVEAAWRHWQAGEMAIAGQILEAMIRQADSSDGARQS